MAENKPILQVCVIGLDGDIIVQVHGPNRASLTIRNPERETISTVALTNAQAEAVADALGRVPEEESNDD